MTEETSNSSFTNSSSSSSASTRKRASSSSRLSPRKQFVCLREIELEKFAFGGLDLTASHNDDNELMTTTK